MDMKKAYLFILSALFLGCWTGKALAQEDPYVHTAPAAFSGTDSLTIYVELWYTQLEGDPGPMFFESAANGGALGNPIEMTQAQDEDDKWFVKIIPNDFYGTVVDSIAAKVKNQAGDKETNIFRLQAFDFNSVVGQPYTVYPDPPNYAENVSLILDLNACIDKNTNNPMTGTTPVYTWMWNNPEALGDPPGQGGWSSISEKAKCVQIEGDIWRKDLSPQAYWETSKAMTEMGFLIRNYGGDVQTVDYAVSLTPPPGPAVPPKIAQIFPQEFTQKDIIKVIYDTKLDTNEVMQTITECFINTYVNDSTPTNPVPGDWNTYPLDSLNKVKMTYEGDGVFSIYFIPEEFYTFGEGFFIQKIYMIFWGNRYGTKKSMETVLELGCNEIK
jgi:hypothetical protein